ncbi:MAG: hypothetical protein J5838_04950 [Desulfovibrio sp.]|nr:hypothetical protein [Desulfovibrio sp.]
MIIVDGCKSEKAISNFANLEEVLLNVMQEAKMEDRVVTDVLVNDELFSEIYPHQAEDLSSSDIKSIEIRTVPASQMALDISGEMHKVAQLMLNGARNVARLFREAKDGDALELLQDLLDVTRDFLNMVSVLRTRYLDGANAEFAEKTQNLSDLISEMSDVLANEDWVLMADLLEYELAPQCEDWELVSDHLHKELMERFAQ